MTVKDLKKFLEDFPDDTLIVLEGNDHSFRKHIDIYEADAFDNGSDLTEGFRTKNAKEEKELVAQYGKRITVLLVS